MEVSYCSQGLDTSRVARVFQPAVSPAFQSAEGVRVPGAWVDSERYLFESVPFSVRGLACCEPGGLENPRYSMLENLRVKFVAHRVASTR